MNAPSRQWLLIEVILVTSLSTVSTQIAPDSASAISYIYAVEPLGTSDSFTAPVGIYFPPGNLSDSVFVVVEQPGRIKTVYADNLTVRSFIDISNQTEYGGEMGLLGFAFDPEFDQNGYFYVNYVSPNPRRTVISRFAIEEGELFAGNLSSELILLEINQPFSNHNGGQLGFSPMDKKNMYIATGDGGSGGDPFNNGQSLSSLLGKILRIEIVDATTEHPYSIPTDNPFVNITEAKKEIFAYGFRNPWRFSFDSQTGDLWVGDVGQNSREEIDVVEKGKNYGWRITEGDICYSPSTDCNTSGLEPPVWSYQTISGGAVIGGFVYRGNNSDLHGEYIYGDYRYKTIWALERGPDVVVNTILIKTDFSFSSFGVDSVGELYVCGLDGRIYQIMISGQNTTYSYESKVITGASATFVSISIGWGFSFVAFASLIGRSAKKKTR